MAITKPVTNEASSTRRVLSTTFLSLLLATTAGCSAATTSDDDATEADDVTEAKEAQQAIAGGTVITGALGIVDFTLPDIPGNDMPLNCTGSMIAPNVVLTAAHCFKLGLQGLTAHQTTGTFPTKVSYYDPVRGRRTVFEGDATWKARDYHYDADFPGDANDDIGVVIIPGTFTETDYHDYKRLYDDFDAPISPANLLAYGAGIFKWGGTFDDKLRKTRFAVESTSPEHIITDNEESQTCGGDSGGPLIKETTPSGQSTLELVVGILALHEGNPDSDFCARSSPTFPTSGGDNSAWLKVKNNFTWIQNTVGLTCVRSSVNNLSYRRCFELAFIEDVTFEGQTASQETALAMTFLSLK